MAKKQFRVLLLTFVLALLCSMSVFAKDYTKKGTYRWELHEDGLVYAYDTATGELIRNCKVGKSYVDRNGTRYLNQFVKGVYYNTRGIAKKNFKGGWIKTGGSVYYFSNKRKVTGYKKISGKYYFFNGDGQRMSGVFLVKGKYRFFKKNGIQVTKAGWKTIGGKRYYLGKNGVITAGWFTYKKNKYYQTYESGILTGEQVINGEKFYFFANGVYDEETTRRLRDTTALGAESDILFFTKFESGNAGYAQTGGDNGKACGKYQFDYRYALVPFIKYCYSSNATFFKDFKDFLGYSAGDTKLINNAKLYKAWVNCYNADPAYFSSMQDQFAIESYYQPAERYLADRGIHLSLRPYVIRGAVFSYAIQSGTITAAQGVIASGVGDSTSNKDFLEKVYDYRWSDPKGWNKNTAYSYRYSQEKALALSILATVK